MTSYCQSCSRPIDGTADFGTEASGERSERFCSCCYADGQFTEPDVTMEELVERVAPIVEKEHGLSATAAREKTVQIFKRLDRWASR